VRKWVKRLAAALAIAGALLVVAAMAVPLYLRGRRLASVVERSTASLCGTVRIQGGRIAATALFDLLLGRPIFFEIEGLQAIAPDGEEVLVAAHVSARVRVRWSPWRIDVHDLRLSSVRWLFVEHWEEHRVDFVDIFRQVKPGSSRLTCLGPLPRPAASTSGPVRTSPPPVAPVPVSMQVHNILFEDVSLRLDFKTWALALEGTWAEGQIAFSTVEGPRFSFEARGVEARRGGLLRVGLRAQQWAAVIPFDHVQIDRYGTDPSAPADMVLDVGRASTGQSALSGRARFTDIFPWGRRSRSPGMDLDARWTQVGDAVERLKRVWGLSRRMPGRLNGDLFARLQGPFTALSGRLRAVGTRAEFDLDLERNTRVVAALRVEEVQTDGMLDPALAPALGGKLSGHARAHVQLGRSLAQLSAAIDEATLRLDRTRRGPWPRRLIISTHALPGPGGGSGDELDLFFSGAQVDHGELSLRELRGAVADAALRGSFTMRLVDPAGAVVRPPLIEARGEARGLDLGRLPGGLVRGKLSVSGEVRGPSDALAIAALFPPGSAVEVLGQPLALPPRVAARLLHGDELVLPTVRLGDLEHGALEVGGQVIFDGPMDARLAVLRLPLERLRALLPLPIDGFVDSNLKVTGEAPRPRVAGEVAFSGVRVGDTALGDGAVTLVPQGDATLVDGRLVPALGVHGRLAFPAGPAFSGRLDLHELPLAPFLTAVPGLSGRLSGTIDLRAGGRSLSATAALDTVALAYRRGSLDLAVENAAPAQLRAWEGGVTLAPVRLRGSGLDAVVEGTLEPAGVRGKVSGQVALAALAPALRPMVKEAAGVLAVELRAEGPARAPALGGTASVREPLRVWPTALLVPVQVPAGRLSWRGHRVDAQDLTVSVASVALRLDGAATLGSPIDQTELDAQVSGTADGDMLARHLTPLLASGRGRATVAGHLGGTAAAPTFDGHADLAGFGVTLLGGPVELRSADGRIEAHGHTFSTSSLALALGPSGRLEIGSPRAPATVEISGLNPPDVSRLSVEVRGQNLATSAPISGLRVNDLDLQLTLDQAPAGPLRIAGDVWVDAATFSPKELRSAPKAAPLRGGTRVAKELFPDVRLDVGVHARGGALEVVVPHAPDVAVTLDCRAVGPLRKPRLDGRVHGDGLYSRMAIFFYDLFTGSHVRRCGAR
jgi:hypothetical protein